MRPLIGISQLSGQASNWGRDNAMAYSANSSISHRPPQVTTLKIADFGPVLLRRLSMRAIDAIVPHSQMSLSQKRVL